MPKEDKQRFIEVAEELNVRYKNFTKEQLEQHQEFKLAAERETGFEEGIEQGLQQGIEQGLQQGLQQGIEQTKIDTVRKMLDKNLDLNLIKEITELTKEEIMKIKESN